MPKNALISVSDKTNLDVLLAYLKGNSYEIYSTGGTAQYIKSHNIKVNLISDLTGFPEILSGRVKTLHPKVFAGILATSEPDHQQELSELSLVRFDLVVVNLYPFAKTTAKENASLQEIIENIDIGGPSLLRAAAKNYNNITVLSSPEDYGDFMEAGHTEGFRFKMAIKTFDLVAQYDLIISNYFNRFNLPDADKLPENISINLQKISDLRYGENPQQKAALYQSQGASRQGLANFQQLQGKEISFNNLLDLNAGWQLVNEYEASIPCCAIIKHNNPCGVAIAPDSTQAFISALACDPISAFGGIVAFNTSVSLSCANELTQLFLECIIAPDFEESALEILKTKKNLRLIKAVWQADDKLQVHNLNHAYLIQETNKILLDKQKLKIVTKAEIPEHLWVDLLLAWKVVKHTKSNAIVVVKEGRTVGIGCGQTNRVKSMSDALASSDIDTRGSVIASDAFFPFPDSIHLAAQNNIAAIIQPGGSIKDPEVIEACDQAGIAMAFTNVRHFKH